MTGVLVTGLMAWRVAAASFHIDAGDLTLTLNEWSRQSDVQILFDFNVINGRTSLPVICECTNEEALTLLLMGTDCIFDFVNDRTAAITADKRRSLSAPPATPEEFALWMRGFEPVAQTYAEGRGPKLGPLIRILPAQSVLE
jgi:hypothetical protein